MKKSKQKKKIRKVPLLTPNRIIFILNLLIHTGIIYFGYSIASRNVYDSKMTFITDRSTSYVPAQGNIYLFWGIVIASIICFFATIGIWLLTNNQKPGVIKPSVKSFLAANIVPIAAIIIAAYITFDQLVGILIYTFFLVLFVFFRDK